MTVDKVEQLTLKATKNFPVIHLDFAEGLLVLQVYNLDLVSLFPKSLQLFVNKNNFQGFVVYRKGRNRVNWCLQDLVDFGLLIVGE